MRPRCVRAGDGLTLAVLATLTWRSLVLWVYRVYESVVDDIRPLIQWTSRLSRQWPALSFQCVDVILLRLQVSIEDADRVSPAVAVEDMCKATTTCEGFVVFDLFVADAAEFLIAIWVVV